MARLISDFNGGVIAPSATYPYGDIQDTAPVTIVDRTSNSDLQQLMQMLMDEGGITANSLADNATNGFQLMEGLSAIIGEYAARIIISMLGADYSASEVYVLSGCTTRSDNGYVLYDGSVYFVLGQAGPSCVGPSVDILDFPSPMDYANGIRVMSVTCGTSGSGIVDFADLVYFNSWVDAGATTFTGVGGTVTVDPGDIIYNKYLLRGKTIQYQCQVRTATFSGSVGGITVSLPFLPSNIANTSSLQVCGFNADDGILIAAVSATDLTIAPASGGNFTTGTNDRGIDINIVFEVV